MDHNHKAIANGSIRYGLNHSTAQNQNKWKHRHKMGQSWRFLNSLSHTQKSIFPKSSLIF